MTSPSSTPHQVQLHSGDAAVGPGVASFLTVALLRGEAAVVIATPAHLLAVARSLEAAGVDLAQARVQGRYLDYDAVVTLAGLRSPDGIDAAAFHAFVDPVVTDLVDRFGAVAAYGEMVGLLAEEGDLVAVLRLEELWVPLTTSHPFRLLCGYPSGAFDGDGAAGLALVHGLHDIETVAVEATWAVDLPASPEAVPMAREAVTELCAAWSLGSADWTDDAVLVVAELVGNAVRHTGSRPTLSVDVQGSDVVVAVTDSSEQLPVPRADPLAEDGRGYLIIDALARTWGVERLPLGKRVWARLGR